MLPGLVTPTAEALEVTRDTIFCMCSHLLSCPRPSRVAQSGEEECSFFGRLALLLYVRTLRSLPALSR